MLNKSPMQIDLEVRMFEEKNRAMQAQVPPKLEDLDEQDLLENLKEHIDGDELILLNAMLDKIKNDVKIVDKFLVKELGWGNVNHKESRYKRAKRKLKIHFVATNVRFSAAVT